MSTNNGLQKPPRMDPSYLTFVNQLGNLLLLMLKMKARRVIFLAITIAIVLSNVYLHDIFESLLSQPNIGQKSDDTDKEEFYGTTDFVQSEHKVFLDRGQFPKEADAAGSIMVKRGGTAGWLKDCAPDFKCRAKLVTESDPSVIGYIRYPKSPSERSVLECLWTDHSSHRCVFLYQLMAQSMQNATGVFGDVQLFTIFVKAENKSVKIPKPVNRVSLPKSICAAWVSHPLGPTYFLFMLGAVNSVSLVLATFAVTFYFLISTLTCIRSLKTNGFFQHLVRSGLLPSSYWTTIWLITIAECALFSALFALPPLLKCPGVFDAKDLARIFLYVHFYFLGLAALTLIFELLIPSMVGISLLMTAVSIGLLVAFIFQENIAHSAAFLLVIFPIFNANKYTMAHMISNMMLKLTGSTEAIENSSVFRNMLINICIVALLLAILPSYLDCLLRSGNGLRLPPYFPISFRFWSPKVVDCRGDSAVAETNGTQPHIEPVTGLSPSIVTDRIQKTFRGCCVTSATTKVLEGLSCTIYRNQITALIGHNGAGKSTLIKILTGEESPDYGTAHINAVNVTDPFERLRLRGSISICPQFDALSGVLTVLENIRVTLNCKGICNSEQVAEARTLLRRLGLADKENVMATDLSGGQKRKVNTILALLGNPDVVFLDEPTSGLDPVSRRQVWQLLQEAKVGRSIVLCTQFMDEADVLADRKIFLCGGQIVCAGSSMFLKRAFGCNYTLNVSLKSKSSAQGVIASLAQHAKLRSQFETELLFEVPASDPDDLVEAVTVLESNEETEAFGVSQATLDDIFMKLSGVHPIAILDAFRVSSEHRSGAVSRLLKPLENAGYADVNIGLSQALHGSEVIRTSFTQQFRALLCTNLRRQRRSKGSICSRFITPVVLLALMGLSTVSLMKNTGATTGVSKVRSVDPLLWVNIVCVHDGPEFSDYKEACSSLSFSSISSHQLIISKPESKSLRSFLSENSTRQTLRAQCKEEMCIVYYSTSWNRTVPNKFRNVSIGVFSDSLHEKSDLSHGFRKAFELVSRLFGAGDLNTTMALSHIKPFSAYKNLDPNILIFMVIFCLFPVSYLSDPIEDISSRVRNHLVSMGMSHLAYWVNTFIMHWVQYSVCFVISVALLCIWDRYRNGYFILVCLPILVLGTASNQMTVYTIAAVMRTKSTIVSLSCNLVAVLLPMIFVSLSTRGSKTVVLLIIWLLPPVAPISLIYFSLLFAAYYLEYLSVNHVSDVPDLYQSSWSHSYIFMSLIALPIHIGVMCGIIVLAEKRASIWASCCCRKAAEDADMENGSVDEGAEKEESRVLQSSRDPQNVLEVRQLYKTYSNGVRAVTGVTFGTMAGEIFGLLGANGAGKSTSISVIVGEESATSGECEVSLNDGQWVSGMKGASVGAIGYCPQHSPLFDSVTVTEHLSMYADIRGLPSAAAQRQTAALIQGLGLQLHRDKQAQQLSGGNKRRLCLAIALLGDPALIVIDEASTGVDPENKRFIWSAIRGMLNERRSVMVTTHSMEEVEALCSRVGIMNKGRMIALGTVQQLRSLYGDAYTLDVLLKKEDDNKTDEVKLELKSAVSSEFPGAVALEDLSLCVQFCVPKGSVPRLSGALRWLASNQDRLGMDYFSFYQMSLDQVFVKLVKQFNGADSA